ncbi:hypothetical protein BGW80DRAFT_507321 [Lactifluus volemus]|nr:hypothetical protein BGW80DRAFT_507321 [Lactifluus volemus]
MIANSPPLLPPTALEHWQHWVPSANHLLWTLTAFTPLSIACHNHRLAPASLLFTLMRMLLLFIIFLRRVPVYLPISLRIYTGPLLYVAGYLEDAAGSLSIFALVYVGLTGEGFWASARHAKTFLFYIHLVRRIKRSKLPFLLALSPHWLAYSAWGLSRFRGYAVFVLLC